MQRDASQKSMWLVSPVSVWLVWRQDGLAKARLPINLFALQLGLNSVQSIIFFGLRDPGVAMVDIVLLWAATVATMTSFWYWSHWNIVNHQLCW
jgi:translocator protein